MRYATLWRIFQNLKNGMLTKSHMALDANSRLKPVTQGIFKFWSLFRSFGSGTASFFGRKQRRARKASDFHRERDVWERGRDRRGRDPSGAHVPASTCQADWKKTWELLYSHTWTKRNKNLIWWQDKSQLSYRRIDTPNIIQDKKQLPTTKRVQSKEKFIITKLSKIQRLWIAIL